MTLNQLGISMFVVNTAFLLIMEALSIDFAKRSLARFERTLEAAPKASQDPMTKKNADVVPDSIESVKNQE